MENIIIIGILILIAVLALLRAKKHFKGGGCCGSGSNTIRTHKVLSAPVIGKKYLTIQGIHCENCEARIENALNRLEGVACHVHHKQATISYSQEISNDVLRDTIEKLGYQVTEIRTES